jgi:hypothetical protein
LVVVAATAVAAREAGRLEREKNGSVLITTTVVVVIIQVSLTPLIPPPPFPSTCDVYTTSIGMRREDANRSAVTTTAREAIKEGENC